MEMFTAADFKVFDIPGFHDRMAAIAARIRPKLNAIGAEFQPALSALVDRPMYVHVAKHARRTVNPPDDTWAAFCTDRRGYKKHVHLKFAVSRQGVRLLAEVGPEFASKTDWLTIWNRQFKDISKTLRSHPDMGWYKNEHDDNPEGLLKSLDDTGLKKLPGALTRRRDGQFVIGRGIPARDFTKLRPAEAGKLAMDTYRALVGLIDIQR
jgi:uncharacterized protein YktB (UPF0637 family)